MFMCTATVVIFTGILVSIMSLTLTLYEVEFVVGMNCDSWSKVNKLLCFGGEVNFQKPPQKIGDAVFIYITLAGSNISTLLSIVDFDDCGNLSFMLEHKNKQMCACTGSLNNMFNYTCAKTVNTSDSQSIISSSLQNENGESVKNVSLKFPLVSKEESSSNQESKIKEMKLENSDTWLKVSIAVVILVIVIVILIICCCYFWRTSKKKDQVIQNKDEQIKRCTEENRILTEQVSDRENELTEIKKELLFFKERAALEPHNEPNGMLPTILDLKSKYVKSSLTHSAAAQEPSLVKDDCPDSESCSIPLLKVRSNEAVCPAEKDNDIVNIH